MSSLTAPEVMRLFARQGAFWPCLRPVTQAVLLEMTEDAAFMGTTDPPTLSLLYSLIVPNRLHCVMELGTRIGITTLVMAEALRRVSEVTGNDVSLHTVEHDADIQERAQEYATRCGLEGSIYFVSRDSLDPGLLEWLPAQLDLIYIDCSHSYPETKQELERYWPRLAPGGYLVLHDSSEWSAREYPQVNGGVRRSLQEWLPTLSLNWQGVFLGGPLWKSLTGTFLMQKPVEEGKQN